jgi:hypothetical protein
MCARARLVFNLDSIGYVRQIEGRVRDLAMFNLAIDSKLRGCDVVASKSTMSPRAGTPRIAQLYARAVDRSDLN